MVCTLLLLVFVQNLLLELTQARGGADSISRTRLEAALTSSLVSGQPLSIAGLLQGARGGAGGWEGG